MNDFIPILREMILIPVNQTPSKMFYSHFVTCSMITFGNFVVLNKHTLSIKKDVSCGGNS